MTVEEPFYPLIVIIQQVVFQISCRSIHDHVLMNDAIFITTVPGLNEP